MNSMTSDHSHAGKQPNALRIVGILASLVFIFPYDISTVLADGATSSNGAWIATHGLSPDGAACSACHGADGSGQPKVGIPRLAGLAPSYIDRQLEYFASGQRDNIVMKPYAAALDSQQRRAVAEYFAALSSPVVEDTALVAHETLERGQALFLNGDARFGLVSCSQCHGSTGLGVGDFSPRLAGQSAVYVQEQLEGWHGGAPRDPNGLYMAAIAARLAPSDMEAVASYVATLDPNKRAKP